MFRKVAILMIFLMLLFSARSYTQDAWVARDGAVNNSELRSAILNNDALYIATKNVLYRAREMKEKWEPVFSLPAHGNNEIHCLAGRARVIFIGTKKGLFRTGDYGATWNSVFKTLLPGKNNINYIELSKHSRSKVLVATEKGIFISVDTGGSWQDISGILKNERIYCLALNKESMYAAADSGLYIKREDGKDWERVIIKSSPERKEIEETDDFIEEEGEKDISIRCIAIIENIAYVGFDKNIMFSNDSGMTWTNFCRDGLGGSVNYILISSKNKKIYCGTDKGVFEYDNEKTRWFELYKGIAKRLDVSRILFASENEKSLLAVTDKGLYSFESSDYIMDKYPDIEKSIKTLKIALDGEPTFKELQQAAIRYAEVSPEKIKRWRSESKMRALLPKLSFGIDRNSTDLWHWESGSSTKVEDDILRPGRDTIDWDATLIWELGDLIWSDDQTNIDVRSRLMVQLRNDILDDLRRLYYERKRLQFELMSNPPKDMNAKFEKESRLQELTQAIDDLTGNYFSEHLNKK